MSGLHGRAVILLRALVSSLCAFPAFGKAVAAFTQGLDLFNSMVMTMELLIAIGLLHPKTHARAAWAALGLMLTLVAANWFAALPHCQCFGAFGRLSTPHRIAYLSAVGLGCSLLVRLTTASRQADDSRRQPTASRR